MNRFKVARKVTQEKQRERARRRLEALKATLGIPLAAPVVSSDPVAQPQPATAEASA